MAMSTRKNIARMLKSGGNYSVATLSDIIQTALEKPSGYLLGLNYIYNNFT